MLLSQSDLVTGSLPYCKCIKTLLFGFFSYSNAFEYNSIPTFCISQIHSSRIQREFAESRSIKRFEPYSHLTTQQLQGSWVGAMKNLYSSIWVLSCVSLMLASQLWPSFHDKRMARLGSQLPRVLVLPTKQTDSPNLHL